MPVRVDCSAMARSETYNFSLAWFAAVYVLGLALLAIGGLLWRQSVLQSEF